MNKIVYLASCPICGRALFKGAPQSYIEGGCPKCKKYLKISFTNGGFQASVCEPLDSTVQKDNKNKI